MKRVLLICAVLAGCATQPQVEMRWAKDGATESDYYRDAGQCRAQAFAPGGSTMMQVAIIYASCLQGKGWRQVAG